MIGPDEYETLAEAWLDRSSGIGAPVDLACVAEANGVSLHHVNAGECSYNADGRAIFYDPSEPVWRRRYQVAHELGHIVLADAGHPDADIAEAEADAIASAILCPARTFTADWRRLEGDLGTIAELYRVSWEVAARRVVNLTPGVLMIFDRGPRGHRQKRHKSPWLVTQYRKSPYPVESSAADAAFSTRDHVLDEPLGFRAWYVPGEPPWERVLLLSDPEALEATIGRMSRCVQDDDGSWFGLA